MFRLLVPADGDTCASAAALAATDRPKQRPLGILGDAGPFDIGREIGFKIARFSSKGHGSPRPNLVAGGATAREENQ
jgi:hypothetical protein